MAFVVNDRVKETSTTTGTGAYSLAGAMTGFRAFSSVCSTGDTCYYAVQDVDASGNPQGAWETGFGTYSAASTLTRTRVVASSNANSAVSWSAGTRQVWIDLVGQEVAGIGDYVTAAPSSVNLTSGSNSVVANPFLNPGDWDASCVVQFVPAAGTSVSSITIAINASSPALGSLGTYVILPYAIAAGTTSILASPTVRLLLASAATPYFFVNATFTGGTMTAQAFARCRRATLRTD